ncbi:MAG TPA: hypothetical protein VGS01_13585 [Candidatus Limnocylindria bacterium]|nr:hypothetical protein [Candidatus Limnocylindria bacterium]
MDIIVFWTFVLVVFAVLSLLFAPDSRDFRRPQDRYGSWASLLA